MDMMSLALEQDDEGWVSVYIHNETEKDMIVDADFALAAHKKFVKNQIIEVGYSWGYSKFVDHAEAKLLLKDGVFELVVKVSMEGERLVMGGENTAIKHPEQEWKVGTKIYDKMENPDFFVISCPSHPIR